MAPALTGAAPSTGATFICFDATPLTSFNDTGSLDLVGEWLKPVAYTPFAVIDLELKKRPKQNAPTIAADWLHWVPSHPDDTQLVADLLKRFGKAYPENLGEAETVAASKRYGWTAVLDDEEGRGAADDHGVPHVYTVTLLAVAVGLRQAHADQGLAAPRSNRTEPRAVLTAKARQANKAIFVDFCNKLLQLLKNAGEPPWPVFLATPNLDALLLELIQRARYRA